MGRAPRLSHLENLKSYAQLPLLCDIKEMHVLGNSFSPGGPEGQLSGLPLPLDFDPVKHRWVRSQCKGGWGRQVALSLRFFSYSPTSSLSAIISHFAWSYIPHMSLAQRTKKHSIILKLGRATCRPLPLTHMFTQLEQVASFSLHPPPPFSSFGLEWEPSLLQGVGGTWSGTLTAGQQREEPHLLCALTVAPGRDQQQGTGTGKSCGEGLTQLGSLPGLL